MVPIHPRILVVDDEASVLMTLSTILRNEGYQVDVADGGEAALEAVSRSNYDVVMTDLNMPRVDGLAVLREVRKCSPNTVTLMVTGYSSIDSALEAIQAGAYEYLIKPVEIPELKAAITRSLERKRLSEIDTLYEISQALSGTRAPAQIIAEVSSAAAQVLGVQHASVIRIRDGAPLDAPAELRPVLSDRSVLDPLVAGLAVTSASPPPRLQAWSQAVQRPAYVFIPGLSAGKLHCILYADNGDSAFDFHAAAQRFLHGLADQAAVALENAALVEELRRNNQELETANAKLQELDRLKSQFLSVATHELRTPLSIILGYNSMLADSLGSKLDEEELRTLDESIGACKRLIRLVNTMLDISRIEAGMEMNLAVADLRQLLKSVAVLFKHDARQRGIELTVEIPTRLPKVTVDAERFQQVLINLIGNALKFTPRGGRVTVAVHWRSEKNDVTISVSDTGVGIPEGELPKIFDPFAQARRKDRQGEGSGLGLAITRKIVEAHSGHIDVQSCLGQGTTFRVTLPARARESLKAVSA